MEQYERAYMHYMNHCKEYGIPLIDMVSFIQSVTGDQVEMMLKEVH